MSGWTGRAKKGGAGEAVMTPRLFMVHDKPPLQDKIIFSILPHMPLVLVENLVGKLTPKIKSL